MDTNRGKVYSIKDAAQALGIHPKTIRRWEQAGKFIPQRTLGNQRRFTPQDLTTLKNIKTGYVPSANQPTDRLLTIDQTAQKLGVASTTIQRWTKEGRLNLKVNNQLQSGYSAQQINSLRQSQKPQPVTQKPSPAPLNPSQSTIPPAYLYAVIGSIILSLLVLGQLYLKNQSLIAKPTVNQLDLSQPTAPALPQVANFLNGQITIGSDTGQLSFLDDKGNLFLKNAALVQGGVFSNFLQLLPSTKPDAQIGRHYVDKESGDLMYFDGLTWTTLNPSATSSADLNSLSASASASTSALILPYTVLGGADQEIFTIDDNSAYPVLISQPTKILANLYAPKLLDSDSETYFIDPGASGLSLSLAGNATISATLTFSQYGEYITNTTDNYLIFSGGLSVNGTTTYGFNKEGNINANKIEGHDIIQIDNLKLDNNTLSATNDDGLKLYDNDSNGIFIKDAGNVGIGTTAPDSKMQVTGGGLCVGSDANCNSDNNTEGTVYSISTAMTAYDVAEKYPTKDSTLSFEEIVELDPNNGVFVKRASSPYSNKLLGVISEKPAVLLGGFNGEQFKEERQVAITLSGRVPVKIDPNSPEIKIGDALTASMFPGTAQKATQPGFTIGKALEDWSPDSGKTSVMIFVTTTYTDPDVYLTDTGELKIITQAPTPGEIPAVPAYSLKNKDLIIDRIGAFAEVVTAKLRAGLIETKNLIADTVTVNNKIISPTVETEVLTTKFISPLADGAITIKGDVYTESLQARSISVSGELTAASIKSSTIDSLRQKIEDIVASLNQPQMLTDKPKFLTPTVETQLLTTNFISPLVADGQITVAGNISISGTLTATTINSSTIDTIKEKLASLAENIIPGVKEVPTPGMESLLADLENEPIATESAYLNIDSINANAGFFSDYLAVIGQATITDLKVNNLLTLGSVSALNNKIDFLAGLMTLDETGQVIINGNLTVTGTIIASQIAPPPDQTLAIAIASQSAMLIYSDINQPIATFSGQSAQISQLELAASGTATISSGTNNVIINPLKLTDKSQIIVTFNSDYTPASKYWVTKEPELNQFTIFTNYPVNNNTALDWLIIN